MSADQSTSESLMPCLAIFALLGMPAIDILFVIYSIHSFGTPLLTAIPVGVIVGIILCVIFIMPHGNGCFEVAIGSCILFIMLISVHFTLHGAIEKARVRALAHRRTMKAPKPTTLTPTSGPSLTPRPISTSKPKQG